MYQKPSPTTYQSIEEDYWECDTPRTNLIDGVYDQSPEHYQINESSSDYNDRNHFSESERLFMSHSCPELYHPQSSPEILPITSSIPHLTASTPSLPERRQKNEASNQSEKVNQDQQVETTV